MPREDSWNAVREAALLNVFNWYNFADYNMDYGSSGTLPANPVTYNTRGNIFGAPRTFKAQVGMRF